MAAKDSSAQSSISLTNRARSLPWIELLVKLTLLGAPVLYVLGRTYAVGYWDALEIVPGTMRGSAEDHIYFGFVALLGMLIAFIPPADKAIWLLPLISVSVLALLTSVILAGKAMGALLSGWMKPLRSWILNFFAARRLEAEAMASAGRIVDNLFFVILVLLGLAALLLTPVFLAYSTGKNRGEELRVSLEESHAGRQEAGLMSSAALKGVLVECNESNCVLYADRRFIVAPRSEIVWLSTASAEQN